MDVDNDSSKSKKEYLTTTEFATLCGVTRFTIINWINKGKIAAIRTLGKQYRIPLQETVSLLGVLHPEVPRKEEKPAVSQGESSEKRSFLYGFGYGIGRGVHGVRRFSSNPFRIINKEEKL